VWTCCKVLRNWPQSVAKVGPPTRQVFIFLQPGPIQCLKQFFYTRKQIFLQARVIFEPFFRESMKRCYCHPARAFPAF
jgi:hypothetical protein